MREQNQARPPAAVPLYVWVLALLVLLLAALACGLWVAYLMRTPRPLAGPTPTPIIWTATPAPTQPPPPTPTPTPIPTPTAAAGIQIGGYVRVSGTEGLGLSLREEPAGLRLGIAAEGEVFVVLDGPRQADGLTWWKLMDREDQARQGWAAANYLEPVEHP